MNSMLHLIISYGSELQLITVHGALQPLLSTMTDACMLPHGNWTQVQN